MDNFDPTKPGPVKDTGPILFLGLFLLLLAFFILLNALSTREETRTRAVINSLFLTFRAPEEAKLSKEIFISALTLEPDPEDLVDEVERLWVASIPIVKVERLTAGRTMQVILPMNELFVGKGAELRADRQKLLIDTAKVLTYKANGFVNELQFLFGAGDDPGAAPGTIQALRAKTIARELVANGAPPDAVTVGVQEGDPRQLRMRFFVREAKKAYVDFHELGG